MSPVDVSVSAPGSLMIAGEHAVLNGSEAIAMAIDQRLSVRVSKRNDKIIAIDSVFGQTTCTLQQLKLTNDHHYIHRIIEQFKPELQHGLTINVSSDINSLYGLGSSAALLTAAYAAISQVVFNQPADCQLILRDCLSIIRQSQQFASGTDLAASLYGGVISYDPKKLLAKRIADSLALQVVYSGKKETTADVIEWLEIQTQKKPLCNQQALADITAITPRIRLAIENKDQKKLGHYFDRHQQALMDMGLSTPAIDIIIRHYQSGAKISGSGRGDCVISSTNRTDPFPRNSQDKAMGIQSLDVRTCSEGLRYEPV